jgi:hypothetical protein
MPPAGLGLPCPRPALLYGAWIRSSDRDAAPLRFFEGAGHHLRGHVAATALGLDHDQLADSSGDTRGRIVPSGFTPLTRRSPKQPDGQGEKSGATSSLVRRKWVTRAALDRGN